MAKGKAIAATVHHATNIVTTLCGQPMRGAGAVKVNYNPEKVTCATCLTILRNAEVA